MSRGRYTEQPRSSMTKARKARPGVNLALRENADFSQKICMVQLQQCHLERSATRHVHDWGSG